MIVIVIVSDGRQTTFPSLVIKMTLSLRQCKNFATGETHTAWQDDFGVLISGQTWRTDPGSNGFICDPWVTPIQHNDDVAPFFVTRAEREALRSHAEIPLWRDSHPTFSPPNSWSHPPRSAVRAKKTHSVLVRSRTNRTVLHTQKTPVPKKQRPSITRSRPSPR